LEPAQAFCLRRGRPKSPGPRPRYASVSGAGPGMRTAAVRTARRADPMIVLPQTRSRCCETVPVRRN